MALQVITIILLVPAVLACGYYLLLALVGLLWRRIDARKSTAPRHRFAVVIPAHNEEANIARVVRSCLAFDYPKDHYDIFVITDNCTDRTAELAAHHGATCLVRQESRQRGKGHALAWALPQILDQQCLPIRRGDSEGLDTILNEGPHQPPPSQEGKKEYDAVVILDADCRLERHALRTFDRNLADGDRVLQASYVSSNPDESIVSWLTAVANRLENDLFYAPKSQLGLSVLLRGTGMVFHRSVLERIGWQAHSIVEDAEYTIRLYEAGLPVRFVPAVRVWSQFPTETQQLQVQRSRWIGGTALIAWSNGFRLLARGLRQASLGLADLGWTLFVTTRTLVLAELALALLFALACVWLAPGKLSYDMLTIALGLLGLYALYFGMGIGLLGITAKRWAHLWRSPKMIARLMWIAVASPVVSRGGKWMRTPR